MLSLGILIGVVWLLVVVVFVALMKMSADADRRLGEMYDQMRRRPPQE